MMNLLNETRAVAKRVSYFANPAELGEFSTAAERDRAIIQRAADDYCAAVDANDDDGKNKFMAVLLVKFWREIGKMQRKCKAVKLLEYGDYFSKLYYCIDTAMSYRAWKDETKHTNAQACINSTIASRGAAEILYQSNLQMNKANINCASLDTPINGDSDDKETSLADTIASTEIVGPFSKADDVIQMYVDKNKLVEAIVIDTIANNDTLKITSETATYTCLEKNIKTGEMEEVEYKGKTNYAEFWRYRTAQLLMNLPDNYEKLFAARFKVAAEALEAAVNAFRTAKNQKVYKYLDNTLADMRDNKELLMSLLA